MFTTLADPIRVAVATLMFALWASPVAAAAKAVPAAPRGDPVAGVALIAFAVALFVFFAWVAVRIGDAPRPADKVPN